MSKVARAGVKRYKLFAETVVVGTERCRSCKALAPGGEIPVFGRDDVRAEWHLCGRCWGFLLIGLQTKRRGRASTSLSDMAALHLRPRSVHAAIRGGVVAVGAGSERQLSERARKREEVIEDEQWLLEDLLTLATEVGQSRRSGVPGSEWRRMRQDLARLRAQVRELRQRYPL